MFSSKRKPLALAATAISITALLAGCASSNPLDTGTGGKDETITIGSQGFPESEILAQIYGQALVEAGYTVDYNLSIGNREVFLTALQDGSIDLIPDYAGNLLYGTDSAATATAIDDVTAALPAILEPLGLGVTDAAPAEDADAFVVTSTFSTKQGVTSIGDLAKLKGKFTLGANTEFETRWRDRVASTYGVEGWTFTAIDDYGGPLTQKALIDNDVQVADIYTTTPAIKQNNLVVLDDPENLIAAQNIIPLYNAGIFSDEVGSVLNAVSAKLTTDGLIDLNTQYAGDDKPSAAAVATGWLSANGFIK
jgi:osmoprotectant transport system substrate-binding protein